MKNNKNINSQISSLSPKQKELLELRIKQKANHCSTSETSMTTSNKNLDIEKMDFSVFFFSSDGSGSKKGKYDFFLNCCKYAEQFGFKAVWIPERHFQGFGGLFPNPSVLAASITQITSTIEIRAGSVVLPLHHPIRFVEEWSIVDNLSNGRVGVSLATGWHPTDFVLCPDAYNNRKSDIFRSLDDAKRLWRGESVEYIGPDGKYSKVKVFPRPIQTNLPIWLTSLSSPETWKKAGEHGLNILSSLIGDDITNVSKKISIYREALETSGYSTEDKKITLMLHTFIGNNDEVVKAQTNLALTNYLNVFMEQQNGFIKDGIRIKGEEKKMLLQLSANKIFNNSLMGSEKKCSEILEKLSKIGVNEVACLIDFGMPLDMTIESLEKASGFIYR